MNTVEKSIVVDVPVSTAYNQWTQFEEFPEFMEGVSEVRQQDDTRLFWKANIGGKDVEWEAEITEQDPDRQISWRSTTGAYNAGTVTFAPADDSDYEDADDDTDDDAMLEDDSEFEDDLDDDADLDDDDATLDDDADDISYDGQATRVTLRLEYEPQGFFESVGSSLGFVDRRVEGDLERFKDFIEDRGTETGAWRGEVHGGAKRAGGSS